MPYAPAYGHLQRQLHLPPKGLTHEGQGLPRPSCLILNLFATFLPLLQEGAGGEDCASEQRERQLSVDVLLLEGALVHSNVNFRLS